MTKRDDFVKIIKPGYTYKGESLILGATIFAGKTLWNAHVKTPLKTLNRHELIAGATGTEKTKNISVLSEQFSSFGIPELMMDVKGDLSGIVKEVEEKSFIMDRHAKINIPYNAPKFPVELLALSEQDRLGLRASVSEFDPVLF